MVRKFARVLWWALGILLLLLCLAVLAFRFVPSAYVTLINKWTPYHVSSQSLHTGLLPATIQATNLTITKTDELESQIELFSARDFLAQVDYQSFVLEKHNFWSADINQAAIDVERLATEFSGNQNVSVSNEHSINLHELLSALNLTISNTTVQLNPNIRLTISNLATELREQGANKAKDIEQNITIDASLNDRGKRVALNGRLTSKANNRASQIFLEFDDIDLSALVRTTEPGSFASDEKNEVDSEPLQWDWLADLEATEVHLKIDRVDLGEGYFRELDIQAQLDQTIDLTSLKADVAWLIDERFSFEDKLQLNGKLKPMEDGLLKADIVVQGFEKRLELQGEIDPTQPLQSQLQVQIKSQAQPIRDLSIEPNSSQDPYAQWFPFSANFSVSPLVDAKSEEGVSIEISYLKAGPSSLGGQLKVFNLDASSPTVEASIESQSFHYTSNSEGITSDKASVGPLFSQELIDWSWLSSVLVDAEVKIETLKIDQRELHQVNLPIRLDKTGFRLMPFSGELNDGAIRGSMEIAPLAENQAQLSLTLKASGMDLNDLKLVDESLLEGGNTLLDITLTSKGGSVQSIARNLNGKALFELQQARIGNNAFELIGSDLIGELISKLNPFLKSDPTTDLKCAVVKLNIDSGLIKVNKSIAMETSKMALVADGNINLRDETLKLKLEPQAMEGIGLDAGTIVKFLEVGGTLSDPKPIVGADGILKSGAAVGAAIYTGGASIVLDGLLSRIAAGNACERARKK